MFISLEGPDGSGKTTVLDLLKDKLNISNLYVTKEPKGFFRDIILDSENKYGLTEIARMFLFQADRSMGIEKEIRPVLLSGGIVISDRGPVSTFIYQPITTGISMENLYEITNIANKSTWPDLTIIFDCDYETAKKRMDSRELDYFDSKGKDFYDKLSRSYTRTGQRLIEDYGWDVRFVNARNSVDRVLEDVMNIIRGKLDRSTDI